MDSLLAVVLSFVLRIVVGRDSPHDTFLIEQKIFGSFKDATRLEVVAGGPIIILDAGENTLSVFQSPQSPPRRIGGYGWQETSFDCPTGVATDGISYYIADYGNHRVVRYDRNFVPVSLLVTRDTSFAPARFGYPLGVALSRQGDLFVLDGENTRVLKFNVNSRFDRAFGDLEPGGGRLRKPLKIAVSATDHVYVLEPERVVEYDYVGNYMQSMGEGTLRGARGLAVSDGGVIVAAESSLVWFDVAGRVTARALITEIVADEPLFPVRDVGSYRDTLYLLNPRRACVFTVVRR